VLGAEARDGQPYAVSSLEKNLNSLIQVVAEH